MAARGERPSSRRRRPAASCTTKPLHQTVEEAFLFYGPALCVTIGAPTLAELRERRDTRLATPTWSSCASTRSPTRMSPARWRAARAGHRDLPRRVGRRALPRQRGGAAARSAARRWRSAPSTSTSSGAPLDDAPWARGDRGDRLIVSTHDFDGVPAILPTRSARCARPARRSSRWRSPRSGLRRLLAAARRSSRPASAARQVLIAMGAPGLVTRVAARALRLRVDLRRRRVGAGTDAGRSRLRDEFRFGEISRRAALYGVVGGPSGTRCRRPCTTRAFAAAGLDARLPAARQRSTPTTSLDVRRRARRARRQRHASRSRSTLLRPRARPTQLARRVGAVNTLCAATARWIGAQHRRRGLPRAAARAHRACAALARHGARRGRRGARGGRRRCAEAARASRCCARRAEAGERGRRVASAVSRRVAAAARQLGPARQRTPVGMHPTSTRRRWPDVALLDGRLRLRPRSTTRPRRGCCARRARPGCETIGGLDMLVAQAAAQFEWWTGARPPVRRDARAAKAPRLRSGCCRSSSHDHENDVVRGVQGAGAAAARSCRCARRSSPTC